MKKRLFLSFILLFSILCTNIFASTVEDPWLDTVISFIQPAGSSTAKNNPNDALGPIDSGYVSIDIPETLVLAFTNNSAYDGGGNDLRIREVGNDSAHANVYGSKNGSDWVFLVEAVGSGSGVGNYTDIYVDLAGLGLTYVNYLKFEGLDNRGTFAGFDLDAVVALNSGAPVPIPGAGLLFCTGLIALAGLRKKLKR
jgi:hypothetical protein